jgi:catechol 2,3-dioxygenase-like lactoylglutathione lyase family enzyme
VRDIVTSKHFYEQLLGQPVLMDLGVNVAFDGGFAIYNIGHMTGLPLGRDFTDSSPVGSDNFELHFQSGELERLRVKLEGARVQFVPAIQEQPWGQRVFRARDPNGHLLEIGEPLTGLIERLLGQGMSPAEVSERTSLPLGVVRQMAKS